jgi:uncharacterized membrane protein YuzA (DUF378 family)
MKKTLWNNFGRIVYGIVGITGLSSAIWAGIKISQNSFFSTMGTYGTIGFIILTIGGINWGIKSLFNKDIFLN